MKSIGTDKGRLLQLFLFLALIYAATLAFATWFVGLERAFYFSDDRFYHTLAVESWRLAGTSLDAWRGLLAEKLAHDYNALYSIPIIPVLELFGTSRSVFIAALTGLYLVPCCLVLGLLARQLVRERPWGLFYLTTAVALLTSAPWRPVLDGLPGAGGATLFLLSMGLYIRYQERRPWWLAPVMGMTVAAAILFRRHFGYAAVAFYAAVLLEGLLYQFSAGDRPWRIRLLQLGRLLLFLCVAGIIQVALMLLVAPEFTLRSLLTDYTELYDSFRRSAGENLLYMRQCFGDVFLLLGAGGLILAWRRGLITRRVLLLLLLYLTLWLTVWLVIARQITTHVTLHALLPTVVLGVSLGVYSLWRSGGIARLISGLIFAATAASFLHVLVLQDHPLSSRLARIGPWLPAPFPPLRDHALDYDTYIDLVAWLRQQVRPGERLYVTAHSKYFSSELLESVEATHWGEMHHRLHFLPTSVVDSRDFYPLTMLVQTDLVIVATPAQTMIAAEQDVVRVAMEVYTRNWAFSRDFERLPRTFEFKTGFRVLVYRRLRPSPAPTVVRTLARMAEALRDDGVPGIQTGWIALGKYADLHIDGAPRQRARFRAAAPGRWSEESFGALYIRPMEAAGTFSGTVSVTPPCGTLLFSLSTLHPDGTDLSIATTELTSAVPTALEWPLPATGGYPVLSFRPTETSVAAGCVVEASELLIQANP